MSFKIKLGQLQAALDVGALKVLGEIVPPGAQLFRIARLLDSAEKELGEAHKQKVALFKKFGRPESDKDGKSTGNLTMAGVEPEKLQAFNEAMVALLDTEVELPHDPIDWSKLGSDAQGKLDVKTVRVLGALIVEGGA